MMTVTSTRKLLWLTLLLSGPFIYSGFSVFALFLWIYSFHSVTSSSLGKPLLLVGCHGTASFLLTLLLSEMWPGCPPHFTPLFITSRAQRWQSWTRLLCLAIFALYMVIRDPDEPRVLRQTLCWFLFSWVQGIRFSQAHALWLVFKILCAKAHQWLVVSDLCRMYGHRG